MLLRYIKFYLLYSIRILFPIKRGRFLFISMSGNVYGGSPRAFSDFLIQNSNNYICWAESEKLNITDDSIDTVKLYTWKYYYTLLRSQVIVSDQRLWRPMLPIKRNCQLYIQTWHGTALKRIEADIPNLDLGYEQMAKRDSRLIDLIISGSSFMTDIYKRSFWYKGDIMEIGTPRNDIFFSKENKSNRNKVTRYFGLNDEKILLYAPTFRANGNMGACHINTNMIIQALSQKYVWKILVRLHPNLMGILTKQEFETLYPNAIDASNYPDMQELLVAADLLITDYSSSMFDYMYSGKPCIIYATDIEVYDRGFYLSIRELPFPIAETEKQLEMILQEEPNPNYKDFLIKISSKEEGSASQQLYEYLKKNALCL